MSFYSWSTIVVMLKICVKHVGFFGPSVSEEQFLHGREMPWLLADHHSLQPCSNRGAVRQLQRDVFRQEWMLGNGMENEVLFNNSMLDLGIHIYIIFWYIKMIQNAHVREFCTYRGLYSFRFVMFYTSQSYLTSGSWKLKSLFKAAGATMISQRWWSSNWWIRWFAPGKHQWSTRWILSPQLEKKKQIDLDRDLNSI